MSEWLKKKKSLWTKVCNVVQVMQIEHWPMATMPGKGETKQRRTTKPNPDQIVSACSTRRQAVALPYRPPTILNGKWLQYSSVVQPITSHSPGRADQPSGRPIIQEIHNIVQQAPPTSPSNQQCRYYHQYWNRYKSQLKRFLNNWKVFSTKQQC